MNLATRPLFELRLRVPPLIVIGPTPSAFRRVGMIQGGSFEGKRLAGEVITGNDWQHVRPDGCNWLDVRLVLKAKDGPLIEMSYKALRYGPPGIAERLDRGEAVEPADYYFRMYAMFETSAAQYDWINRIIAVGTGDRKADGPVYRVFEVL
jgi:hypothetical protein